MYADVVIDISSKEVDRPFTYRIPEALRERAVIGTPVHIPFGAGNKLRQGFIIGLKETAEYPDERIKDIDSVDEKTADLETRFLSLAIWLRERYGGTLTQALSVVMPNKVKVEPRRERYFVWTGTDEELEKSLSEAQRKKHYARIRLLEAFTENRVMPASIARDRLNITSVNLKYFTEHGLVEVRTKDGNHLEKSLLTAIERHASRGMGIQLNREQEQAVRDIENDSRTVHLLFGVTGSGKTEVYLKLIEDALRDGKEAIVLIPEIALTYQTVMRFYARFGELVSVVHSRVSKGERFARFEEARSGEIKVMIGPRSALFTPFSNPGLIIIDEFHENSYLSEQVPKYSAVETAVKIASENGSKVVLGSATPLVECYEKALSGEYGLHRLLHRASSGAELPEVQVVDLREELRAGNRSIFSRALQEKMKERLDRNEQIMLFLNRRGYSGAVSCRSCGEPVTCPHCSVAMNYHKNGTLQCHFCGYTRPMVKTCPRCTSPLIGAFGIGTEKVEEMVKTLLPEVRTLRMDADTTAGKDGHQEILEKFMNHEADVLIGTQMIVKGHDFKDVTLVGILAADLSLNVPDYRSAERTFELLTQAEGRAGRAGKKGECIVQTYNPEHYAISAAAAQDYEAFYKSEMIFRRQMKYPPAGHFMGMTISGAWEKELAETAERLTEAARKAFPGVLFLGPAEAGIYKVKDMYRQVVWFKTPELSKLLDIKRFLEKTGREIIGNRKIFMTFES